MNLRTFKKTINVTIISYECHYSNDFIMRIEIHGNRLKLISTLIN